jgi:hypothetical protein
VPVAGWTWGLLHLLVSVAMRELLALAVTVLDLIVLVVGMLLQYLIGPERGQREVIDGGAA